MGTVLYEAHYQFSLITLMPTLMLAVIILFPKIIEKDALKQGRKMSQSAKRIVRIFCIYAGIFVGLISLILITSEISMYSKIIGAYERGEYEIVEGYVENFDPMPYEGRSNESFEINGVYFSYSDYAIQQGYHNSKSHGGVISGDGQYLKIGYVHPYLFSKIGNVIVYIEELSPGS
ncbi:MAG: hypothetical protein IJF80_02060 [Clostridia bacterium]|nr:hypothetical protein [Clostridia bacterium]